MNETDKKILARKMRRALREVTFRPPVSEEGAEANRIAYGELFRRVNVKHSSTPT